MYNFAVMETVGKLTGVNQLRSSIKFTQYSLILEEKTQRKLWLIEGMQNHIQYSNHWILLFFSL